MNAPRILATTIAALLLTAAALPAATFTWDGGAVLGQEWSRDNNWDGNTAPPSNGTADLVFAGTNALSPEADAAWSIRSLTFDSFSDDFSIHGSTLTIGVGGITNDCDFDSVQHIANNISLSTAQTWASTTNRDLSVLSIDGSVATNGHLLTLQTQFGTSNIDFTGSITGSGGLTLTGQGEVTLTGANTYTGATTVNGGTLNLNAGAGTRIAGSLVIGDGTGFATVVLNTDNVISNSSDVTVNSPSVLALQGNTETIDSLTLNLAGKADLGTGGRLTVNSLTMTRGQITGTGAVVLNGDVTTIAEGFSSTIVANVELGLGTRTFTVANGTAAADLELSGVISNGGLTKSGGGVLRLSGSAANIHLGSTTVNNGTLELAKTAGVNAIAGALVIGDGTGAGTVRLVNSNQIADTASVTIAGGTFDVADEGETIVTLTMNGGTVTGTTGTLTLGGNVTTSVSGVLLPALNGKLNLGGVARTLTVNDGAAAAIDLTIGAVVSNGSLIKAGAGTLLISGTTNTFSGLTVNAGELAVGTADPAADGALTMNGGTIRADSVARTITNALTVGGNFTVGGTLDLTFGAATTLTGNRTLTVTNTGDTIFSAAIGQDIAGRSLTKAGSGVLTLSAANTFSGGLTLSSGTLAVRNNAAAGTGGLSLNGGTIVADTTARTLSNAITFGGNATIGGTLGLTFNGAGTLTGNRTLTVTNTATTMFAGVIGQDVAGRSLTKAGTETLLLSGANTFSGGLTLGDGTLAVGNDAAAGSGTLTLNAGTIRADTIARTLSNAVTFGGDITIGGTLGLTFNGAATLTGNRVLLVDNTATTTFSGVIGENAAGRTLTKNGAGTLVFSGANTFSGGLTLNAGTFAAGNDAAAGLGAISLNGATIRADTAARTLSNAVTLGAGITIGGALDLNFSGAATLTGNRTLTVTNTGTTIFSGAIGQNAAGRALTKSGNGTLRFSGATANSYSGATTIDVGTLLLGKTVANGAITGSTLAIGDGAGGPNSDIVRLEVANQIADAVSVTVNSSGLLDLNGNNETLGGVTLVGGRITTGAGTLFLLAPFVSLSATATATITGKLDLLGDELSIDIADSPGLAIDLDIPAIIANGALLKGGAGTLLLSGANTFGSIEVDTGELAVGNNSAAGAGSLVLNNGSISASGTARTLSNSVTLGGNTTFSGALGLTFTGPATLSGNRTLTFTNTATTTFSGVIGQDVAGRSLTKAGAGTLVLSGANTFSGGLTLSAGTLAIGNNAAAGSGTLSLNGGTIRADTAARTLTNAITLGGDITIGGTLNLTFGGAATLTGNRTLDVTNTGLTAFSGTIGENAAGRTLTKIGAGALVLSGSNTFSGGLTVSGGTLAFGDDLAAGSGPLTLNSGITIRSDTITPDLQNPVLLGGNITIGGSLALLFTGTTTLTANAALNVTNTGLTTLDDAIGQNAAGRALTKDGTGTLLLSGANTFSGGLTVNAGELALGNNAAAGSGPLTLNGGSIRANGAARTLSNPLTLGGNATVGGSLGLTFAGPATLTGNRTLTFSNTATTTFSNAIGQDAAGRALTKDGAGLLILAGANTYTGATTVNTGTLELGNTVGANTIAGALIVGDGAGTDIVRLTQSNQIADGPAVTVNSSGLLDMATFSVAETLTGLTINAGSVQIGGGSLSAAGSTAITMTGGSIAGSIGGTLGLQGNVTTLASSTPATISAAMDLAAGTRTFLVNDGSTTDDLAISGAISNGALFKTGAGRLILSGVSNYSGNTTVSAGTLIVNGSNSASSTTVNNAATIGGIGITGSLIIASGGSLSPGTSAGTLTTGNLTLLAGSLSLFEVMSAAENDRVVVNGNLAFGGTLTVPLINGFQPQAGNIFNLFDWGTTAGAFSTVNLPALNPGLAWSQANLYTAGEIQVVLDTAFTGRVWDGGGANNDWATDFNWDLNVEPLNNGTADLIFAGTTRLTPSVDTAWNVHSITFNNTAGAFTIAGPQGITVGAGGITNNDADLQTITALVTLSTSETFTAAAGDLAFANVNIGANTLMVAGANDVELVDVTGTGTITKTGAGTLDIIGTIGTGDITFNANAGTTNIGADETLAALNIGAGAIVTLGAIPPAPGFAPVPEPGIASLLGVALLAILARRRRA